MKLMTTQGNTQTIMNDKKKTKKKNRPTAPEQRNHLVGPAAMVGRCSFSVAEKDRRFYTTHNKRVFREDITAAVTQTKVTNCNAYNV